MGRENIRFTHVKQLVQSQKDTRLESALRYTSCILTVSQPNDNDDVPILVDFVKEVKARNKALLIITQSLNSVMLPNMTINFEVRILHQGTAAESQKQIILLMTHLLLQIMGSKFHRSVQFWDRHTLSFKMANAPLIYRGPKGKIWESLTLISAITFM